MSTLPPSEIKHLTRMVEHARKNHQNEVFLLQRRGLDGLAVKPTNLKPPAGTPPEYKHVVATTTTELRRWLAAEHGAIIP